VAERYEKSISKLAESGDDLGFHPHAYRWSDRKRRWVVNPGDQAWTEECVSIGAAAFERSFGRPCRTFRLGDRWINQGLVELLQRLGARHDLTLEPGLPPANGSPSDHRGVPEGPYRPSRTDFRVADPSRADGLIFIPMTTAAVRPRLLMDLHDVATHRGRRSKRWTALLSHDPVLFRRVITAALQRGTAHHLALPLRTGALAVPRIEARVARNLEWMLTHPLRRSFRWSTADETMAHRKFSTSIKSSTEGSMRP
jgi:hypothetical protein